MTNRRSFSKGFTLIELMVVIALIVVLMSILIPIVGRVYRTAKITSQRADLATLAAALHTYQQDFGDFPRNPMLARDLTGKPVPFYSLAIALLGPGPLTTSGGQLGDGAAGLGFRATYSFNAQTNVTAPSGKVWGPYISADTFKVAWETPTATPAPAYVEPMLLDRWGTPIQYFPRYGPVSNRTNDSTYPFNPACTAGPLYGISTPKSLYALGQNALFDMRDATNAWTFANPSGTPPSIPSTYYLAFQWMLGDGTLTTTPDNLITTGETLQCNDPFVLISAGPDMQFCNLGTDPSQYNTVFDSSGNVYSFTKQ